jgi:DNA-binding response OmpR family regulator
VGADQVLLVEDDPSVSDVVRRYLEREGMVVKVISDGTTAVASALADPPDIVVLDLMLPGLPGLEVCRRLRGASAVPVVMLTALGEEADRVAGLELGADDYVTKPFSPRELTLRVLSVLRRGREPAFPASRPELLVDGDLTVDVTARVASAGGRPLALTIREFDLLAFLLAHPRQAFTRADLLDHVWGWSFGDQATVTVHVRRLREKLSSSGYDPHVVTVWGVGYRYDPGP